MPPVLPRRSRPSLVLPGAPVSPHPAAAVTESGCGPWPPLSPALLLPRRRRPGAGTGPEGTDQHRIGTHQPGAAACPGSPPSPEVRGEGARKRRGGRRSRRSPQAAARCVWARSAPAFPARSFPIRWSRILGSGPRVQAGGRGSVWAWPAFSRDSPGPVWSPTVLRLCLDSLALKSCWNLPAVRHTQCQRLQDVSVRALNQGVPFLSHDTMPSSPNPISVPFPPPSHPCPIPIPTPPPFHPIPPPPHSTPCPSVSECCRVPNTGFIYTGVPRAPGRDCHTRGHVTPRPSPGGSSGAQHLPRHRSLPG